MKKIWVRPSASVQQFVANEYVALCWKIKCNVPYGYGFYDKNGDGKYTRRVDEKIASGKGCGTYHIGVESDNGPEANAMWQPTNSGEDKGDAYSVFHWVQGKHGTNDSHHFSKVSDAQWETNPNAS